MSILIKKKLFIFQQQFFYEFIKNLIIFQQEFSFEFVKNVVNALNTF